MFGNCSTADSDTEASQKNPYSDGLKAELLQDLRLKNLLCVGRGCSSVVRCFQHVQGPGLDPQIGKKRKQFLL